MNALTVDLLLGVLLLGILQGILLAALASILMLLARASSPHVAFLGRVPRTNRFSATTRHPENEPLPGVVAFRPEASLLYVNADSVLETVSTCIRDRSGIRVVICDLLASPYIDLAGSRMLHQLQGELALKGIGLRVVGAHGRVRDLLRADGVAEKVGRVGPTRDSRGSARDRGWIGRPQKCCRAPGFDLIQSKRHSGT